MILGIGIDIVSVHRISHIVEKWGRRFIQRILTRHEMEAMPTSGQRLWEYLAGRFAAKEAFLKAIGTGVSHGVGFKDVWIVNGPSGRPDLFFSPAIEQLFSDRPIKQVHVSLSHERQLAIAMVVLEG